MTILEQNQILGIIAKLSDDDLALLGLKRDNTEIIHKEVSINSKELIVKVSRLLSVLGIPAHTHGYTFIKTAIILCIDNPDYQHKITTELYPKIAEMHKSSVSKVERAIRHAIITASNKNNEKPNDVFMSFFGTTLNSKKGRPTNSDFIAILANDFRIKLL